MTTGELIDRIKEFLADKDWEYIGQSEDEDEAGYLRIRFRLDGLDEVDICLDRLSWLVDEVSQFGGNTEEFHCYMQRDRMELTAEFNPSDVALD